MNFIYYCQFVAGTKADRRKQVNFFSYGAFLIFVDLDYFLLILLKTQRTGHLDDGGLVLMVICITGDKIQCNGDFYVGEFGSDDWLL